MRTCGVTQLRTWPVQLQLPWFVEGKPSSYRARHLEAIQEETTNEEKANMRLRELEAL